MVRWVLVAGSAVSVLVFSVRCLHTQSMSANAGTGARIDGAAQAEAEGLGTIRVVGGARRGQGGFHRPGVALVFRRFGRSMRDHLGDAPD